MEKKDYLELKAQLKKLAREIRENKGKFRESQSNYDKFRDQNLKAINSYYATWIETPDFKKIAPEFYKLRDAKKTYSYKSLSHEFRVLHVLLSLARGKTYNQIEPKTRDSNSLIDRITGRINDWKLSTLMSKYDVKLPQEVRS